MSILSALKTKGAKGKNIEEAVKTLPLGGGGVSFYGPYSLIVAEDGTIAAGSTDTIYLSRIASVDGMLEYNFPSAGCCFILNAIKVGSWDVKDDISIMKFDLPFYYSDAHEWDGAYLTLTNNASWAFPKSSASILVYTTEELTQKA